MDRFAKTAGTLEAQACHTFSYDGMPEQTHPLMKKLGFPFLLCHNLEVNNDEIVSYKL